MRRDVPVLSGQPAMISVESSGKGAVAAVNQYNTLNVRDLCVDAGACFAQIEQFQHNRDQHQRNSAQ
jgi:hypothetical protein